MEGLKENEDDVDLNEFGCWCFQPLLGISAGYLHSIVLIFWTANRIARLIQGVKNSTISLSLLISFLLFHSLLFRFSITIISLINVAEENM